MQVSLLRTACTDPEIATFDEDEVYNQADADGFINLFGLPIKVYAHMKAKTENK